ncbi:nuclear transport factor 2 family protein [Streptomyces sp. NPDC006368]|uniref:nuclear transport factor 2 family protein n=1 Tax=Streptomyces sp. NPDC006368 TaxID=3156760 RepID=UPI0033A43DE5
MDEAIAGELRLADPAVRASRAEAARLLHPDFVEVGASGRRWTRDEMLAELPEMAGSSEDGPRYEISGLTGTQLATDVVHLTYESVIAGRRARRSSLWRRRSCPEGAGWQLYHHQATPTDGGRDMGRVPDAGSSGS